MREKCLRLVHLAHENWVYSPAEKLSTDLGCTPQQGPVKVRSSVMLNAVKYLFMAAWRPFAAAQGDKSMVLWVSSATLAGPCPSGTSY